MEIGESVCYKMKSFDFYNARKIFNDISTTLESGLWFYVNSVLEEDVNSIVKDSIRIGIKNSLGRAL